MTKNYIPQVNAPFQRITAATLNRPLQQIDESIEGLKDGSADLDAPAITSFVNSAHTHANAAGGGTVEATDLKSTGASAGKVLTADGANGSAWQTPATFEAAQRQGLKIRKLSDHEILIGAGSVVVAGVVVNKPTQTVLDKRVGAHWIEGVNREDSWVYMHVYVNSAGDFRLFDLAPNRTAPSTANLICAMQVNQSGWNGTTGLGLNATSVVYDSISSGDEANIAAGMLLGVYSDISQALGRGKEGGASSSRGFMSFARITAVNTGTDTLTLETGHQIALCDNDTLIALPEGMVIYRYEEGQWWRWLGAVKNTTILIGLLEEYAGQSQVGADAYYYTLGNVTTTSTTWVELGNGYGYLYLLTQGGDVKLQFHGTMSINQAAGTIWMACAVDGDTPVSTPAGSYLAFSNPDGVTVSRLVNLSFTRLITGLLPGTHIFRFLWRVSAGTGTFPLNSAYYPQIWAEEVMSRGGRY
jgi:hypothetical protein